MLRRVLGAIAVVAIAAVPLASGAYQKGAGFNVGSCELGSSAAPGSGALLQVGPGKQFATINGALVAAQANDHILIYPGVYAEKVTVNTAGLRFTGTDRDGVILDGENTRNFGFDVRADRVVVENMTGHNYTHTAFYWTGVTGYWGRYLTAYNNRGYGVYAYDARCGQFDNSYASGSADSGFYIGECYPCDAVITNIEAQQNALGYSGTNAGGNLLLKDSLWHENGMGIVPNSLDSEFGPPQHGLTIENNRVLRNNGIDVPGEGIQGDFYGAGIVIAGGSGNQIIGNTVTDHTFSGIVLAPLPDTFVYVSSGNRVWRNTVSGSGLADLAQGASSGPNNCWNFNDYGTSAPPLLETVWGCTNMPDEDDPKLPFYPGVTPPGGDPRVEQSLFEGVAGLNGREPSDWRTWPAPICTPNPGPSYIEALSSCVDLPDENGDSSYANDAGVDSWLPALL